MTVRRVYEDPSFSEVDWSTSLRDDLLGVTLPPPDRETQAAVLF